MCKRYINQLPLAYPQVGTWPSFQACALTGDQTSDPVVHRPALNPLSHSSQGRCLIFEEFSMYRKVGKLTQGSLWTPRPGFPSVNILHQCGASVPASRSVLLHY